MSATEQNVLSLVLDKIEFSHQLNNRPIEIMQNASKSKHYIVMCILGAVDKMLYS